MPKTKPLLLQLAVDPLYQECCQVTNKVHRDYCERHGYDFHVIDRMDAPLSWNKMAYKRDLMCPDGPEYIFYIDADAMIMQPEYDLRDALPKHAWIGCTISSVPWTYELWHYQIGVTYWRNCLQARKFLDAVLARKDDPDTDGWMEQGAFNRELLENREWQSGLATLPTIFNSGGAHWLPREDAIVAGFHARPDRSNAMRRYARWLTYKDHVLPYLKGQGVDFGSGLTPVPNAYCLVDRDQRVYDQYALKWCPHHPQFWSPYGNGTYFDVHIRDITKDYMADWVNARRQFDFVYMSDLMNFIPDTTRLLRTCREILKPGGALIVVESDRSARFDQVMAFGDHAMRKVKRMAFGDSGVFGIWVKP